MHMSNHQLYFLYISQTCLDVPVLSLNYALEPCVWSYLPWQFRGQGADGSCLKQLFKDISGIIFYDNSLLGERDIYRLDAACFKGKQVVCIIRIILGCAMHQVVFGDAELITEVYCRRLSAVFMLDFEQSQH